MDANHPLFATADSLFYDKPNPGGATTAELFAPADTHDWGDWSQGGDAVWSFWAPRDVTLPGQGWKLHVSATAATADHVLSVVSSHCHRRRVPFKFLRHRGILAATLGKDADRLVAGKFITVYPTSTADLHTHLIRLDAALAGLPGPYVLTDLRWNRGPVYVRYGAFTRQHVTVDGVDVPAIRDMDTGRLVPDVRTTAFHVPPWVSVPGFLQDAVARLEANPPAEFPHVRGALHFSNAGGVYEADWGGQPVILKEARPGVGWTPDGRDAVARLHDETVTLRELHDYVPVPEVLATFSVHEHAYLAMERVEAPSLSSAVVSRNPLATSRHSIDQRVSYRDWALRVAASLRRAVEALHLAGRTHGDLHPGNVLVREDDTVVLIDLEMSYPIADHRAAVIGAPGFAATDGRSPIEQDLYALACIELFMFVPLIPLLNLDADKPAALLTEAADQFHLNQSWIDDRLSILTRRGSATRTATPTSSLAPIDIARTLRADASVDRTDRLWPGDPRQFQQPPTGLAHGALGVLTVLHAAGLPAPVDHRTWIEEVKNRSNAPTRFGLFDGLAGEVWAWRGMGCHAEADSRLAELQTADLDALGYDLYGGLPGVGLTYIAESARFPALMDTALQIADRLREHWRATAAPSKVTTGDGGLLHGATGSALFAMRLFEITADTSDLQLAMDALDHDLQSLTTAPDGSLQVDEGWRLLPYLGNGSAGIGIVLAQLLAHMPGHRRYLTALDLIAQAATAPFTVQSGLLQGRAGFIQLLLVLERTGHATPATSTALHNHVAALSLHALRRGDEVRFAGDGLLRASCDLATGAAGVLATLIDYHTHTEGQQPSGVAFPYLTPRTTVEDPSPEPAAPALQGGETHGVPPVLADTRPR